MKTALLGGTTIAGVGRGVGYSNGHDRGWGAMRRCEVYCWASLFKEGVRPRLRIFRVLDSASEGRSRLGEGLDWYRIPVVLVAELQHNLGIRGVSHKCGGEVVLSLLRGFSECLGIPWGRWTSFRVMVGAFSTYLINIYVWIIVPRIVEWAENVNEYRRVYLP